MKLDIFSREKENEHGEMDFLSRIFKLIRGNTDQNSLKRRSEEKPDYSQLTKYRKVNNEFPKIIEKPFEDDTQIVRAPPNVSVPLMSQKRRINERSTTVFPMRKSNNFAELEYSDDEEEILQPRRPLATNSFEPVGYTTRGPDVVDISKFNLEQAAKYNEANLLYKAAARLPGPFIQNIPVRFENTGNHRSQVPPLIEARTGNIITSVPSNVPDLKPIRKSFLSDIINSLGNSVNHNVQSSANIMNGNVIGVNAAISHHPTQQTNSSRRSSLNCMNGTLDSSPKIPIFKKQNAKNVAHSSYMINPPNTVVNQVYNFQEKETYEQLLKTLAPSLYNSKKHWSFNLQNGLNTTTSSNKKSSKGISGRKSIHDPNQIVIDRIDLTRSGRQKNASKSCEPIINLDDDEENKDVIDLDADETSIISQYQKLKGYSDFVEQNKKEVKDKKNELPYVEPINTLKEKNELTPLLQPLWLTQFKEKFALKQKLRDQQISEATEDTTSVQLNRARKSSEETERAQRTINEKLKSCRIAAETIIIDEEEEEEEVEFPEFTDEDDSLIKKSIYRGSADEVLIQKFNMSIRRRDIQTLVGDSWLNDEVINFYMNLLIERGELLASEGYPKVYAMNTFFIPRLMSSGHSGVRRWTRKVDLFSYEIIPVPVHVGGVHWCMAIIHMKNKTIKYYDSMGTPNPRVLQALEQYLKDESQDKKGIAFDTSDFTKESVADCPRQMNGSDCGVFSCMFAEYITRNKNITFSQQHMQYFRHKMILEIVKGKLLL